MSAQNETLEQLAAALTRELGTNDKTLVEYIWNLRSRGAQGVKKELADFGPVFMDKILSILGLKDSKAQHFKVGAVYEAEIESIDPHSVYVKLNAGSGRNLGAIRRSQLRSDPQLRTGDKLQVRVRHVGSGDKLDLEPVGQLVGEPGSRQQRTQTSVSDKFEIQQLQASGNVVNDGPEAPAGLSTKPSSHFDVVMDRKIPQFLSADLDSQAPVVTKLKQEASARSWLNKAAQHTSSKVFEANSNSRRDKENAIDSVEGGGSVQRPHSQPKSSGQTSGSSPAVKKELPVRRFRLEILQSVAEAPIVVVVGDTGSGKTTQITQFLYDAGYAKNGRVIACTQPRRLAAISIAQRVAHEMQTGKVGGTVGYSVRFDDCTSPQTEIKYMTDGILQHEIVSDPDLSKYSVIMLDEAHERTIATDVLFALLKAAVARRPDLRVIVTSATLDAARFATYFGGAPILRIPGRTFPVTIEWSTTPVLDYMEEALSKVKEIHHAKTLEQEPGDILVFLTGQAEIDLATKAIAQSYPAGDLIPLPVYAAIPSELQALIFDPAPEGKRKVIFATNIAETSLTIEGIRFVVDPGFSKIQVWDANSGMGMLRVEPISQAQANQRSGRAGRTAPGVCYRLYTKHSFEKEMVASTVPEIQRSNLGHMVLLLKAMGVNDVMKFDFMDPPSRTTLVSSLHDLFIIGAIEEDSSVTALGRRMTRFPLDPALAKVLISAQEQGDWCLEDMLTIIAMLSMPSVLYRPSRPARRQKEADDAHRQFQDISGDHITLLNIYNKWVSAKFNKKWCESHFLQYRNLLKAKDARKQLADLVKRGSGKVHAPLRERSKVAQPSWKDRKDQILRTLCSGYFQNVAKFGGRGVGTGVGGKMATGDYTTLYGEHQVSIHPSSVLFRKNVNYVLYDSLIMTSKEYMHVVSEIRPEWLVTAAPHFWKKASSEDTKKRRRTESLKPLFNKYATHENEWRVSEQRKTLTSSKRH